MTTQWPRCWGLIYLAAAGKGKYTEFQSVNIACDAKCVFRCFSVSAACRFTSDMHGK